MTSETTEHASIMSISAGEYAELSAITKESIGLDLGESRRSMVQRRLAPRLKRLGLNSFSQYLDVLKQDVEERASLSSSLTTNVTHFFREEYHFDYLSNEVLPELGARVAAGQRARIWSCASSSGEEPYSIAMTILETIPDADKHDLRLLATDIDPEILRRARQGRYDKEQYKGLSLDKQKKFFQSPSGSSDEIEASAKLKSIIDFARLNLLEEWPFRGQFDVIFCRNVAIYFDQPTQDRLWQRLVNQLVPNGVLCIGHSESVPNAVLRTLRKVDTKTFRKI